MDTGIHFPMFSESNPLPVDGVTSSDSVSPSPENAATPPTPDAPQTTEARLPFFALAVVAVIYAIPAFVLLALFPRADGGLNEVKHIGTILYAAGAVGLLVLLLVGFMRIAAVKEHRRMRFFASMRLLGFTVPLLILSGVTAALINVPPTLRLEVLSPDSVAELIAPVPVTFGMRTALTFFERNRLKPLEYEWDYNNDGVVDQKTFDPQSTYLITKAGIYNIVARVTMTNGDKKNVVFRLVVPRASFALTPARPIIDEPTTFSLEHLFPKSSDAAAPKLLIAKWDFDGDGNIDLETDALTAVFTYRKLGSVNASVSMTLANQSQSSLQRTIMVEKAPEQPFPITVETEPQMLLGPPPLGVLFTLKTNEPIASASWDFGNGKTGEGLRVAHVYSSVGTFTVTINARSQSGSIARISKVVRVTNPLDIRDLRFEGEPAVSNFTVEGPVPLTVKLTPVTIQPLISFTWDAQNAEEVESTDNTFSAMYRDTGKYFVDLVGIDPDQNVYRRRITINALEPKSLVTFTLDPAAPTAPALVQFDASDTFIPGNEAITGFEWEFGDGLTGGDRSKFSGARVEHLFERTGTYIITLTVRTTSGKQYTGKQTLVVRAPLVDACFMPSRRSGKSPLGVRFDAGCSTGDFVSWLWNFGDDSESDLKDPTHVFLQAGEYVVTLTATTRGGSKSVSTSTISVTTE